MFVRSMISFDVPCLLFSLGKVFERLRLRRMSLSLFGLQLGRRFLQGTFYGVEALILLIGVSCVGVMGSRRITCFFTMEKLFSCGTWFSDLLGFLRSCLDRFQTRFSAGGTGSESTLLEFGI